MKAKHWWEVESQEYWVTHCHELYTDALLWLLSRIVDQLDCDKICTSTRSECQDFSALELVETFDARIWIIQEQRQNTNIYPISTHISFINLIVTRSVLQHWSECQDFTNCSRDSWKLQLWLKNESPRSKYGTQTLHSHFINIWHVFIHELMYEFIQYVL